MTFLSYHELEQCGALLMLGTTSTFQNTSLACDFSHWGQTESQIQFLCLFGHSQPHGGVGGGNKSVFSDLIYGVALKHLCQKF